MLRATRTVVGRSLHFFYFPSSVATFTVQMSGDVQKCSFKVSGSPAGMRVSVVTVEPRSEAKNRSEIVT